MESIPTITARIRSEPTQRAAETLRIAALAVAVVAVDPEMLESPAARLEALDSEVDASCGGVGGIVSSLGTTSAGTVVVCSVAVVGDVT